jgi:hypothetical protein
VQGFFCFVGFCHSDWTDGTLKVIDFFAEKRGWQDKAACKLAVQTMLKRMEDVGQGKQLIVVCCGDAR